MGDGGLMGWVGGRHLVLALAILALALLALALLALLALVVGVAIQLCRLDQAVCGWVGWFGYLWVGACGLRGGWVGWEVCGLLLGLMGCLMGGRWSG